jgi:HlyD family secretion protein
MSTDHDTCASFEDALIAGTLTNEQQVHAASCARCQGVIAMTMSIKDAIADVPVPAGQRPQWIAETHARVARRRKRLAWGGAGLAFAATAAMVWMFALHGGDEPRRVATEQMKSPPVQERGAKLVAPAPVPTLLAAGYLGPRAPILIAMSTEARIKSIDLKAGDRVSKNQIVAEIDEGQLRAELSRENTRVRDANRNLDRMRKLVRAQAATQAELERAMGELEIAQADRQVIAAQLKATQLRSPIDGTVLEVLASPGDSLRAQSGVMRIADLTQLVAEVNIAESDLADVFMGQRVIVTTDARRDHPYSGFVHEIAQQADRARGTVMVKVAVESDAALRPNMAVQAKFFPKDPTPSALGVDVQGRIVEGAHLNFAVQVAGKITELVVAPGDLVAQGERIALVDGKHDVTAPVSGIVVKLFASVGNPVNAQQAILEVVEPKAVIVVGKDDGDKVFVGQRAELITGVQRHRPHRGTVRDISPSKRFPEDVLEVTLDVYAAESTVEPNDLAIGKSVQVRLLPKEAQPRD